MEYNQNIPKSGHMPVLCWGHKHLPQQNSVATYALAQNRIPPINHVYHKGAVFNTLRRVRGQFLYVVVPFGIAYFTMSWAVEKNEYLNSKQGRLEQPDEEG